MTDYHDTHLLLILKCALVICDQMPVLFKIPDSKLLSYLFPSKTLCYTEWSHDFMLLASGKKSYFFVSLIITFELWLVSGNKSVL